MKKGRHRRYEEARALKRSDESNLQELIETFDADDDEDMKPEHASWAAVFDDEEDD